MGINHTTITYRNPRRTDWEPFRTDLSGCLNGMKDKISNCTDLEIAANQFQDAFAYAYCGGMSFFLNCGNATVRG
jgi:hypothetical protein